MESLWITHTIAQFILSNGDDEVVLSSLGVEVDRVEYDGGISFPDEAGSSMSLDGNVLDDASNDAGENWCVSNSSYGGENSGTPGVSNDACPVCGNGTQEPGGECDDGNVDPFDGCERCTVTVYDICGNGIVEAGEDCDFGTANSDTEPDSCRSDCTFAGCGDGVVDTGRNATGGHSAARPARLKRFEPRGPGDLGIMIFPLTANPLKVGGLRCTTRLRAL